jgi:signal transduction histidine kinase
MKNRIAIKIALIYFLTGFLWIIFSDHILQGLAGSAEAVTQLQTYKGWFFVSITAVLLFLLVRNEIKKKNIIEADLIKTREKAVESDRLKSAFLSNMSHEIRTPLNGIMGFCELILDDSFTGEDKLIFAKHMAKNGNDLLKLINNVLDISRIQENQFEITKKSFKLNALLENIYNEFQLSDIRLMRSRVDFKLIKGIEEGDIELFSDPVRLTHVFQNLLHNAFFFTNEGFVRFGYRKLPSGLEFFVVDSGCGIDENNKELIFKSFFKGRNHMVGNRGFGLGLAISKGLVKLLGGDLKFDSFPNVGSQFYFVLDNEDIMPGSSGKKGSKIMKVKEVSFAPSTIKVNQN